MGRERRGEEKREEEMIKEEGSGEKRQSKE